MLHLILNTLDLLQKCYRRLHLAPWIRQRCPDLQTAVTFQGQLLVYQNSSSRKYPLSWRRVSESLGGNSKHLPLHIPTPMWIMQSRPLTQQCFPASYQRNMMVLLINARFLIQCAILCISPSTNGKRHWEKTYKTICCWVCSDDSDVQRATESWWNEPVLKTRWYWLEVENFPFNIMTVHKNLEYIKFAKQLTPCQAWWALLFTTSIIPFTSISCSYTDPGPRKVK